jgi:hypothetical protein
MLPIDQRMLAYPIRITVRDNLSTGSGFLITNKEIIHLVTATHVLFDKGISLYAPVAAIDAKSEDTGATITFDIDCAALFKSNDLKKHLKADVTIAKLGNTPQGADVQFLPQVTNIVQPAGKTILRGLDIDHTKQFASVPVSAQTIMFGYPASLGVTNQIDRKLPLLRHGIVAGRTDDGRLIIDCAAYPGFSGSLVVVHDDRIWGIGIATEAILFEEKLYSNRFKGPPVGLRYENSGYCIVEPFDRIIELL